MFGSHLSIAGGMHKALLTAERLGLGTVQVFTKNQKTWAAKPLDGPTIDDWRREQDRLGFTATVSHDSYLINLASPDDGLWDKSVDLFAEEVRRCDALGIPLLVTHPGAHMGQGESAGLRRVADGLDEVFRRLPGSETVVCLESTAGQGTSLGWRLEHLAEIVGMSGEPGRLAACLDTAHLFAAGYDWRGAKFPAFVRQLKATVGTERVKVWHLNDSKRELGSRIDRHEHVGLGHIGDEGFRPIVRRREWRGVPKVLETPKGQREDGVPWDEVNVARLRNMLGQK